MFYATSSVNEEEEAIKHASVVACMIAAPTTQIVSQSCIHTHAAEGTAHGLFDWLAGGANELGAVCPFARFCPLFPPTGCGSPSPPLVDYSCPLPGKNANAHRSETYAFQAFPLTLISLGQRVIWDSFEVHFSFQCIWRGTRHVDSVWNVSNVSSHIPPPPRLALRYASTAFH